MVISTKSSPGKMGLKKNGSSPLSKSPIAAAPQPKTPADIEEFKLYGKHVFTGRVANEYLKKYGQSHTLLKNAEWTQTHADVVAAAVLDW